MVTIEMNQVGGSDDGRFDPRAREDDPGTCHDKSRNPGCSKPLRVPSQTKRCPDQSHRRDDCKQAGHPVADGKPKRPSEHHQGKNRESPQRFPISDVHLAILLFPLT